MKTSRIPPPPARRSWSFASLVVGDSFFVPTSDVRSVRSSAWGYKTRNHPWDYVSKHSVEDWTDDKGKLHPNTPGIRLWRIV